MEQAVQIARIKKAYECIDNDQTTTTPGVKRVPVAAYTDLEWQNRELNTVFKHQPLFMGLSCVIAEPGDYVTLEHSIKPLLMVRGDDDIARAFINMCSHRGAPVAQGCGRAAGFTCPYHAWSYDRAGSLKSIPDQRNFPGIEPQEHGLIPLPLVERHGMIWVLPDPGGEIDLDTHLEGLQDEMQDYQLQNYVHYESRVLHRDINWKMPIDTFLESYHFATLHRDTVGPIFYSNLCLFEGHGLHHWMAAVRKSIETLRGKPEAEWDFVKHTAISYQLFPNTMFTMQADHVETWRVFPVKNRVDQCVIYFDCYVPEPVTTEKSKKYWDANIDLAIRTVDDEDIAIQTDMERNFLSGSMTEVLIGQNEPALAHFHQSLKLAMAEK
ncbi:MAG: Rieske 2Fe-2S domain-containing protein [Porticoccaceae bacterium]|nr:Rieske 2Fe-2S domain-containing protein [Porticoccaceae bacterium]